MADLLAAVFMQELFHVVQLAVVGRQVLTDPNVQLLQFQFVVVVRRVPQLRLLLLKPRFINDKILMEVGQIPVMGL